MIKSENNNNQTKTIKVYGWGNLGLDDSSQLLMKMISPNCEFTFELNCQLSPLTQCNDLYFCECKENGLLQSLFAHILSEMILPIENKQIIHQMNQMKEENKQTQLNYKIERKCGLKLCCKCNNYSLGNDNNVYQCQGCQNYFHSFCFYSNSTFCSKDCYENIFKLCEYSNILYPYRIMKKCLICQHPFASKEEELLMIDKSKIKDYHFCCKQCFPIAKELIKKLYFEKCSEITTFIFKHFWKINELSKQKVDEFIPFLYVLKDDMIQRFYDDKK